LKLTEREEKYFSHLTPMEKGFLFEMSIQKTLMKYDVSFEGNPSNYEQWKKQTKKGYDLRVKLKSGIWICVECKFLLDTKKLHLSWFKRDWETRTADVFVTNDRTKIPQEILDNFDRPIMNVTEFIEFITGIRFPKKFNPKGNKLFLNYCNSLLNCYCYNYCYFRDSLQPPEYFNVGDNVKWSPFSPHFVTFLVSSLGYSLDTLKHTLNSSNKHQNHFQRKLELKIEPLLCPSRTLFVYSNSTSYIYLLEQFRDKPIATTWKPVHLQKSWC